MSSRRTQRRLASLCALSALFVFTLATGQSRGDQGGCSLSTFTSRDVPRAIPDPGAIESALSVPAGTDPVAAVVVHVTVTHTFDSDLKLELLSPNGTTVILAEAAGMWGHDFTSTVFADAAPNSILSQLPPFTGTFQPAEPLSAFAASPRGGTWKLRVTDLRARYAGQLRSWALDITTCPNVQPPPKTVGAPALPPLPAAVPTGHIAVEGTLIMVTTITDLEDGNASSVNQLLTNPGPDGAISLREAIQATNHDPGTWTTRFAPALAGTTISVINSLGLPPLSGGGVLIDGDIDGDGRPDVTIKDTSPGGTTCGLTVLSSSNRLHALALQGFPCGIMLSTPFVPGGPVPSRITLAQNIVSGVEVTSRDVSGNGYAEGIFLRPNYGHPECDRAGCDTHNTWTDTRFIGNHITSDRNGIETFLTSTNGDVVERLTIASNDIHIGSAGSTNGKFGVNTIANLGAGNDGRISDALVAYNTIAVEGAGYAINAGAGSTCGSNNVLEDFGVIFNRVQFSQLPLIRQAARGFSFQISDGCFLGPSPGPFHDDTVVRRARIVGNLFEGQDDAGIMANDPCCAGDPSAMLRELRIADNVIRGIIPPQETDLWGIVVGAHTNGTDIVIDSNTIEQRTADPQTHHAAGLAAAGIALVGGLGSGTEFQLPLGSIFTTIRNVSITNNRIDTDLTGIVLVGGGPSDEDPATDTWGHSVSDIVLRGNVVVRSPVLATGWDPGIKGISLIGGLGGVPFSTGRWRTTTFCSVTQVTLDHNIVAGVVDDVSLRSNFGEGASHNVAALGCPSCRRRAARH